MCERLCVVHCSEVPGGSLCGRSADRHFCRSRGNSATCSEMNQVSEDKIQVYYFVKSLITNYFLEDYRDTRKKSGLSQNTDYNIFIYSDVLNANPLSVWFHQPLILRKFSHKSGKLRKTGFMKSISE